MKKNNSNPLKINEYHTLVNKLFLLIEENIDKNQEKCDIDCELHHNMLIINLNNTNQVIINKQESLKQIWLATKKNGYHFEYINKQWICNRTKKDFWNVLQESCVYQTNKCIQFLKNIY
ncbi:CyaY [Buchnera aphidicola str. Bp (Baizongia pistaciae)]|uniref:Iron-sulfur cluster assembly protein CyaY n=1 Tax=Buchnera aphidicola subsp. Baizongia pistaciae (strain Bp) TaxID=224915 RepID=CYAY_BUCBP|nr:iron donor protein CyaY [Buchnera aphidicola]P59463.1 RecName: Full=Iron-sulfur cluster assembly protein CyaY [Buchnera aphidicola str. Bp (Baizongia pistaciae)]AAO27236.1 CyaY [Buchnera aphidicola str. Bp (Baizongia pistaciae)]